MTYTAASIAAALGIKRQAAQWHLRGVAPAGLKIVRGNEAEAWEFCQLPAELQKRLQAEAQKQNCRDAEALLTMPRRQWQPPLPLDKICEADIQAATQLREALQPFLIRQHDDTAKGAAFESAGLLEYRRIFGNIITARYWRELFARTISRDRGFEDWSNLALYLPERPRAKAAPAEIVSEALAADFADLENFIAGCGDPRNPTKDERAGLWKLALVKHDELLRAGQSEKSAGRRVRQFLFSRANFLAASRDALRKAFELRLANGIADQRASNGSRPEYPSQDIRRVRHSAVRKNGNRIDAAWREEYPLLSEYTRQRHPFQPRCPITLYKKVNRLLVNALHAAANNQRELKNLVGRVKMDHAGIPSMSGWSVDDVTSNIQVAFRNSDGTTSLILPQIVAVMDNESRKIVGWARSNDGGPTSRLVCAAVKDAFKKEGVPSDLGLENGWVFGGALNVNGKEDENGRMIVAGLAQYGCRVHHYQPNNPTSKADLENSFNLLQQRMERHPGYSGRIQMLDASDNFKREQRLIESGKVLATESRYTFEEFLIVFHQIVEDYNATPQHYGRLKGLSPNEAFEMMKDPGNPPTKFDNKLQWLLDEKYRVTVKAGGVKFTHYGKPIRVVGGELPQHIGEELWALVDMNDASMVSFMSLDFKNQFTVEVSREPSAAESRVGTSSDVLARERQKIGSHMRTLKDQVKEMRAKFGDPRRDLLAQIRGESTALVVVPDGTTRRVILNSRLEAVGPNITAQRAAIKAERREKTVTKSKASRVGIPAALVRNDARSRRAIELAEEASREASRLEATEEIKP